MSFWLIILNCWLLAFYICLLSAFTIKRLSIWLTIIFLYLLWRCWLATYRQRNLFPLLFCFLRLSWLRYYFLNISSCCSFPNIFCFLLKFQIQIWISTWGFFRIDELVFIIWNLFKSFNRVKSNSFAMFLCCESSILTWLHGKLLFLPHFKSYFLSMNYTLLNDS